MEDSAGRVTGINTVHGREAVTGRIAALLKQFREETT
jgi:hypothetical protein